MTISQIIEKMIAFSEGNIHDIDHFIRVWTYAKTIGELESLDANTQYILEIAAIIHDIACPLCREKYGNTNGKHQEAEGMPMAKEFLRDTDHQILLEADYIANASENGYSKKNVENFIKRIMQTDRGKELTRQIFCI